MEVKDREPSFYVAVGEKGVGKTYQTIKIIDNYVAGDMKYNRPPKKVLVLDVNNEYTKYKLLDCTRENILGFMVQKTIEARRVGVYKTDGNKKSLGEIEKELELILDTYKSGLLVIEDISRFVGDSMSKDLYGSLCTNRHIDCDIITHYQSAGKAGHPKIKATMNILRFHHVKDSIYRHKNKFEEYTEIIRIAQIIVNNRWKVDDKRFFLYINFDNNKITGVFNKKEFDRAIFEYIAENESETIAPLLRRKDPKTGKKMLTYHEAFTMCQNDLIKEYYGNK